MLAHCPAFRAARERPPGLPACARPLEHWIPCLPFPLHRPSGPPGPLEADWPREPANFLTDWTRSDRWVFPQADLYRIDALARGPEGHLQEHRHFLLTGILEKCGVAFLHTLVDPAGQRPPIFCQLRQHHPPVVAGYRRVIRPNLTGLFTARLIRDTLTGNTWLSWVVVHFSLFRRSRSGTSSPSDRPWGDLSSAIPLASRLNKPATD